MDELLFNDDDLAHLLDEPSSPAGASLSTDEVYDRFKYEQYDWTAAGFDPDYAIIRLGGESNHNRRRSEFSGVYFTTTAKLRYTLPHVGGVPWYPLVEHWRDDYGRPTDKIKRICAHRRVGPRIGGQVIYLHRLITNITESKVPIDHRGQGPLDNRDEALHVANYCINNFTAVRKKPSGLLPGVEWRAGGWHKQIAIEDRHVRGVIMIEGERIRSEETWPLSEQSKAHEWYLQMREEVIKRLTPQSAWTNSPKPVPPLVFPPLKTKSYLISIPAPLSVGTQIPF